MIPGLNSRIRWMDRVLWSHPELPINTVVLHVGLNDGTRLFLSLN